MIDRLWVIFQTIPAANTAGETLYVYRGDLYGSIVRGVMAYAPRLEPVFVFCLFPVHFNTVLDSYDGVYYSLQCIYNGVDAGITMSVREVMILIPVLHECRYGSGAMDILADSERMF